MKTLADFEDSTKLKEELLEGEVIEWKGRPEPFPLIVPARKKALMLRWIICAACAVILSAAYIYMALTVENGADFNFVVELVILLLFGYVALIPIMDRNKIIKKCKYYITDRRVIVAVADKDVFALSRKGIKLIFVPGESGCVNVLFGSAVNIPARKAMLTAIMPVKDEKGEEITGIEFYNIKDDKTVRELLPN